MTADERKAYLQAIGALPPDGMQTPGEAALTSSSGDPNHEWTTNERNEWVRKRPSLSREDTLMSPGQAGPPGPSGSSQDPDAVMPMSTASPDENNATSPARKPAAMQAIGAGLGSGLERYASIISGSDTTDPYRQALGKILTPDYIAKLRKKAGVNDPGTGGSDAQS
jgi:hypothetical protein